MASSSVTRATLDDLLQVDGKAELIDGRIVHLMPTGNLPSTIAFRIAMRLYQHSEKTGGGVAHPDGVGYAISELVSGRESFCPDASWFDGELPANKMRFIQGSPTFAVEVRSENDYGDSAEAEMAAKRADYFEAGTKVVWDVDPQAKVVHAYRCDYPDEPAIFGIGEIAHAEPAVPGWNMKVNDIFGEE